jgi:microsomal dipeptidase-like Zn-dependent dipeptidase
MQVIRTATDLRALVQGGGSGGGKMGAIMATEGLHPLEGKIENVDKLYDAGFRITGLTHFFDNEVAGSANGMEKGSLTPFGRDVVRLLEQKKIVADLAHNPQRVIDTC